MSDETPRYGPSPPSPTMVVGPEFTAPHPMDLILTKKFSFGNGSFAVTDANGNVLNEVKQKGAFSSTALLLDNGGNSIVALRPKILSLSGIWRVYRGNSSEPKDLLFTIKDSSFFKLKHRLNVFLAHNEDQKVPDFIVKSTWSGSSCTIYIGDSDSSNNIIAQMNEKKSFENTMKGKVILAVSVNPNIDYAFIVTLVVALHKKSTSSGGGGGASAG